MYVTITDINLNIFWKIIVNTKISFRVPFPHAAILVTAVIMILH